MLIKPKKELIKVLTEPTRMNCFNKEIFDVISRLTYNIDPEVEAKKYKCNYIAQN